MLRLVIISLSLLTLNGCYLLKSPAERMDYLLAKHPELSTKDTLFISDTLVVDSLSIDTVYTLSYGGTDTIIIRERNVVTRVIRSVDTLKISTNVAPDTIVRTKRVTVERVKHVPMGLSDAWAAIWSEYKWWLVGLLVLVFSLLFVRALR